MRGLGGASARQGPLELWGGVECTVNRVGDTYFDQVERSGHARRLDDLDLLAGLGVRALRYPVLWERTAPGGPETADWSWADARLARLRELGVDPIAGLVHHGSGPRHTNLLDPAFPEQLAAYAHAVAERYPWVERYTPVNEPLTTARFGALYGLWYPHARGGLAFAKAQLNECKAVVLAMQAIREVNPAAKLVQTDDLGKTFSTRKLAYQAAFENERRWLTFDLLCGRVEPGHWMWQFLTWLGVPEHDLAWFSEHRCPPDIIGINHYLTSERFLDQRLDRYPRRTHGGNGRDAYADVEAVRVRAQGVSGTDTLLLEVWERYHRPIAITEAHLTSTRDEQVRWLAEVWRGAEVAREAGADVRAVTAWSLLGMYDWDSLVTRDAGHYEVGAFDLRAPRPRPTAVVPLLRELAAGQAPSLPPAHERGWWQRDEKRLLYPPVRSAQPTGRRTRRRARRGIDRRPVLVTGATGTLGSAFGRLCDHRGLSHRLLRRQDMDIASAASVGLALDAHRPWAVVNAAGYVRVDLAEDERDACFRENADGPAQLAEACAARGIRLLTISSDLVFDGHKQSPYVESDATHPLNVYGRSKAAGEQRVLAAHPGALVVRSSAFFGPWDEYNFVTVVLRILAAGKEFLAADDQVVSPTYVPDLVHACLDLLIDGERGLWHLANQGALTWLDFAQRAASMAGVPADRLEGRPTSALGLSAARPRYTALGSERGWIMPSLDVALERYFWDCREAGVVWPYTPHATAEEIEAKQTDPVASHHGTAAALEVAA